jgi:hypothetical protein
MLFEESFFWQQLNKKNKTIANLPKIPNAFLKKR